MSELTGDTGTIPPLSARTRWCAAMTVCDESTDAAQAVEILRMLGLVDPQGSGYVPSHVGGDGEAWYPRSPFTLRQPTALNVLVRG